MCGIAGFTKAFSPLSNSNTLKKMGELIFHRGPDAGGEYIDNYVGLAHRRLSIIDLSPLGNQPMVSNDGRYVIVFNGEIYNYRELRKELLEDGYSFKTQTDTEVILAIYAKSGVNCLEKLNGMFAFALWDKNERRLFIARDRVGKKPLYYYHKGGDKLAFASEIKSLLLFEGGKPQIDETSIVDYLKYLYIPAPKTIFKNIYKLPPAHFLNLKIGEEIVIKPYWDLDFTKPIIASEEEIGEELLSIIDDSVKRRMISDVPLGAFLSGGVDSSAVVGLMARSSSSPVKTCCIGFLDKSHDESPYAREISELFKTDHKEYFVQEDIHELIKDLPTYFDEPFADSSAVPTYHVSRLARRDVTVAISGDGGDESFAGYEKYVVDMYENRVRDLVPAPLLMLLNRFAKAGDSTFFSKAYSLTSSALMDSGKAFYITNTFIHDDFLDSLLSEKVRKVVGNYDPSVHTMNHWNKMAGADHLSKVLYTDIKSYLPGDILTKVDRMSMANSLEVRSPLLDYRVLEFAAKIPGVLKLKGKSKKYILKESFRKILPQHVMNRKKHGFTVPLDSWFRNELVEFGYENIVKYSAMEEFFSKSCLENLWQSHRSKLKDNGTLLWSLLMFSLWHKKYM